jgi:dCMP deaminase
MDHSKKTNKWDKTYMGMAELIAQHSHAVRNKVGAILVKDNRVISVGYNGTPQGFNNDCEDQEGNTKKEVLHAESNAISKCAKSTESSENSTLYVTLSPCIECAKLIIQCGIDRVVYKEKYRDESGTTLLIVAGVQVQQLQ